MAKATSGREIYEAIESFTTKVDGVDASFVGEQTLIREGHPLLLTHGHLFRPVQVDYDIEAATSAPGELRDR